METIVLRRSLAELDRRRKNPDENQKGFTLIELLVVIIIIGILAAIAIPVFLNQRESAWKSSVASDLKNAAVVVETWGTSNNGSYKNFAGTSATAVTIVAPAAGVASSPSAGIKPSAGNTLVVTIVGGGTSYTIKGTNSNITTPSGAGQTYDSTSGGLGAWG